MGKKKTPAVPMQVQLVGKLQSGKELRQTAKNILKMTYLTSNRISFSGSIGKVEDIKKEMEKGGDFGSSHKLDFTNVVFMFYKTEEEKINYLKELLGEAAKKLEPPLQLAMLRKQKKRKNVFSLEEKLEAILDETKNNETFDASFSVRMLSKVRDQDLLTNKQVNSVNNIFENWVQVQKTHNIIYTHNIYIPNINT